MTEELAQEAFPDNEYIIATHTDKNHIHCHIIVNSVSFVNGKMLHFTNNEYGRLKDRSNEIAAKYGYSTLDFRKPSADRIKSEERHIVLKGSTSWKEELREVIAEAKRVCNDMESFEKHLSKYGVTIARNTAKTISYLHPNKKKPIRGSKLGKAYTKEAILYEFSQHGDRTDGTAERTAESDGRRSGISAGERAAQANIGRIRAAVGAYAERGNSFIRTQSAKTDDLTKTVAGLVTANQLLAQNLERELNKLAERLAEPFSESYRRVVARTEASEKQLSKQTEKYIQSIDSLISQTEERKTRFFTFNRIKSIVFWSGWASAIILLLMEVLRTLIMK